MLTVGGCFSSVADAPGILIRVKSESDPISLDTELA